MAMTTDHADSPLAKANAAIVRGLFDTVLSGPRDVAAIDRFLAPSFIDHDANGDDPGPSGVAAKITGMWTTLPNGSYRILALVAAGDLVMVRSLLEGGEIPVEFADTYRVDAGLIVEHWHVVDDYAVAAALGSPKG